MSAPAEVLDAVLGETAQAIKLIKAGRSPQVRANETLLALKSYAYAWFKTHRPSLQPIAADLSQIDGAYQTILDATERFSARGTYINALGRIKESLIALRPFILSQISSPVDVEGDELAPDFVPLVGSSEMREILLRRWDECRKCVSVKAHLAAIVMMGGLLEALFVARANALGDKRPLVTAAAAPRDKITGKTVNYQDWMLDSYIKVGRELRWISDAGMQVADVLKEFRNYVHPAKELRHGVTLMHNDSAILWSVTKSLVRQLLASVG